MCHPKAKPVIFSHPKTAVALLFLEPFFNLLSLPISSAEIVFKQHFDHLFFVVCWIIVCLFCQISHQWFGDAASHFSLFMTTVFAGCFNPLVHWTDMALHFCVWWASCLRSFWSVFENLTGQCKKVSSLFYFLNTKRRLSLILLRQIILVYVHMTRF